MRLTETQKQELIRLRKEGHSYSDISLKMGIRFQAVYYNLNPKYRESTIRRNKLKRKIYYQKNKEKILKKNRNYNREYQKAKYQNDPIFREKQKERARKYKERKKNG